MRPYFGAGGGKAFELNEAPLKHHFFAIVHKSIVSPSFYREVRHYPPAYALKFVVQMCLITALISGAAFTYYALDADRGLPSVVPGVFPGMSLNNGTLDPGRPTPYVPEKAPVIRFLNGLMCVPDAFDALPDSFIVVDTSSNAPKKTPGAQLVFSDRFFFIKTNSALPMKTAYSRLLPSRDTFAFTRQGTERLLRKNVLGLFIWFFIQLGVFTTGTICVSIIFLTFAVYIFRIDKKEKAGLYFKKACFAATPIFIGTNLVALSGTRIANTWYVLLMIAGFVMVRGVKADQKAT